MQLDEREPEPQEQQQQEETETEVFSSDLLSMYYSESISRPSLSRCVPLSGGCRSALPVLAHVPLALLRQR